MIEKSGGSTSELGWEFLLCTFCFAKVGDGCFFLALRDIGFASFDCGVKLLLLLYSGNTDGLVTNNLCESAYSIAIMVNFSRQRRPQLPTEESPQNSEDERLEKDNPHNPENVTWRQRIKQ
jgi:hypothetical protein